eukprot:TRINITY_DN48861_c0_g1_i1.p1 TRINITY_DN48861_c0_g1~~TRINITY_DN48861_c0_g1_i1.p1  ORF type:complete len:1377 (+),score=302.16 TRINITY_DN48861_c0_g1_i1:47-4177(+)
MLSPSGVGHGFASESQRPWARPSRPTRRSSDGGSHNTSVESNDAPHDLLRLEDFNDNELLRALWTRYERKEIYTWVGSVLVSVNPYSDIGAFKEEMVARYASSRPPQAPHLFAIVRAALSDPGNRHALLITGESGAGKTEATRAVLQFLAIRHTATDYIRDRLLRSTPVLEAFGNAHTRQNTNSSRFGKFIEVHVSAESEVVGATLTPYMLEASRVSGDLPTGERTYHVFYLLRSALGALANGEAPDQPFWQKMAVAPEWAELISSCGHLLRSSKRLSNSPKESCCLEWFKDLVEGLLATGMRNVEVAECMRIVAAVALLSDTEIGEESLKGAATLLRIEESQVRNFLTRVEMSAGSERVFRARTEREAATLRASLAQELYAALFAWLTRLVARGIAPRKAEGGRMLGLLDLYGFEVFPSNGFEQFLINYCNERLQQFFNRQVFTHEAEEYAAEGLDCNGQWKRLMSACTLPALGLLEGQPGQGLGVFGTINDRSRCNFEDSMSGGAQGGTALAETLEKAFGTHAAFRRAGGRDCSRMFGVKHFAGEVFYEAAHFVRKNASAHRPDIVSFLRDQGGSFVREVLAGEADEAAAAAAAAAAGSGRRGRKLFGRTLISVFQQELNELCSTLESRQCRHIRCLRPNDEQKPLEFDDQSMLRQCRYSGLLEATRIRKLGYSHRRHLRVFASRYAMLLNSREARRLSRHATTENAAAACKQIVQVALDGGVDAEDARIGTSKVFMRENALNWFEATRNHIAVAVVTAVFKGHVQRQTYRRILGANIKLQAFARGCIARQQAFELREKLRIARERKAAEAAARIQAALELDAAVQIQSCWRGKRERRCVEAFRQQRRIQERLQRARQAESMSRQAEPPSARRRPQEDQPKKIFAVSPKKGLGSPRKEMEDIHRAMQSPDLVFRPNNGPSGRWIEATPAAQSRSQGAQVTFRGSPGRYYTSRPLEPEELVEMDELSRRSNLAPRAMHRSLQQECITLLAHLPKSNGHTSREQAKLVSELMKVTDTLSKNQVSSSKDEILRIKDRVEHIKALLQPSAPTARVAVSAEPVTYDSQSRRYQSYQPQMITSGSATSFKMPVPRSDIQRSSSAYSMQYVAQSPRSVSLTRGCLSPANSFAASRSLSTGRFIAPAAVQPPASPALSMVPSVTAGYLSARTTLPQRQTSSSRPASYTPAVGSYSIPVPPPPASLTGSHPPQATIVQASPLTSSVSLMAPQWAWKAPDSNGLAGIATAPSAPIMAVPVAAVVTHPPKTQIQKEKMPTLISSMPTPSRSAKTRHRSPVPPARSASPPPPLAPSSYVPPLGAANALCLTNPHAHRPAVAGSSKSRQVTTNSYVPSWQPHLIRQLSSHSPSASRGNSPMPSPMRA